MGYYLASLYVNSAILLGTNRRCCRVIPLREQRGTSHPLTSLIRIYYTALPPILALLYLLRRRHRGIDNLFLACDASVLLHFVYLLCWAIVVLFIFAEIAEEQGALDPKAPTYVEKRRERTTAPADEEQPPAIGDTAEITKEQGVLDAKADEEQLPATGATAERGGINLAAWVC